MIIAGIGNQAGLDFLKDCGIEIGHGIIADEYLKTNLPDVWTAGDIAEFSDVILEEQVELGNWVNAQSQGRVAGLNMTGQNQPFKLISSYNALGFGIIITMIGDVRPEKLKRVIIRKLVNTKSIIQLFERFGELVGATFINGTDELPTVTALIEKGVKVTGLEANLADPNFPLHSLLPN